MSISHGPVAARRTWLTGLLWAQLAITHPAHAASATLLEPGNDEFRQDLQWLIDRGIIDFSTSTWPISLDALSFAISKKSKKRLSNADRAALWSVRRTLRMERAHFGVELGGSTDAHPVLQGGMDGRSRARSSLRAGGDWRNLSGRLQLNGLHRSLGGQDGARTDFNLDGSYVSAALQGQVLYAGQLARWWGPGQQQSLIWSDAARAIPTLGVRRGRESAPRWPWLSWVGPWGYDLSVGQLQHYRSNPGTRILAMRLHARPMRGLEIGASRFIQWGGDGAGPAGLGDALIGRANSPDRAPNNELAGFDLRYGLPLRGGALAFYGQAMGEDEAGAWPAKYLALLGTEYRHVWRSARMHWWLEAADTKADRVFGAGRRGLANVAYAHSYYRDGLRHEGVPIGAWTGGDARMYSLGLNIAPDPRRTRLRYSLALFHVAIDAVPGRPPDRARPVGTYWGTRLGITWRLNRTTDMKFAMAALGGGADRPFDLGAGLFMKTTF